MRQGHGDDGYRYDRELKANFSSNVWYEGIHPQLKDFLNGCIERIDSYPQPDAEELLALVAKHHQLSEDEVIITNGATEAFYLIAQAFHGQQALIFAPTFSEYQDASRIHQLSVKFAEYDSFSEEKINEALVFVCNPNNPDGRLKEKHEIEAFLMSNPQTYLCVDEAYMDYVEKSRSVVDLVRDYKNLIIVKSLTKNFAIPGLRLGYLICNSELRERIIQGKMPWNVNQIAIEAGKYIFQNVEDLVPDLSEIRIESKRLKESINSLGWIALPSFTPYFLVKMDGYISSELKRFLIEREGMLIRDASNFEGLDQRYIRLSPQSVSKNNLLIKAFKKWKSHYRLLAR